jgi:hypothetical protein
MVLLPHAACRATESEKRMVAFWWRDVRRAVGPLATARTDPEGD